MQIKVDQEFKALIPPLTDEEFKGLEESIIREGCRDALVVWEEESILLDGHNRHQTCIKNGIAFETTTVSLPSRHAAKAWIAANQINRRNITPETRKYLIGIQYREEKADHGGAPKGNENAKKQRYQNDTVDSENTDHRTSVKIAKQHGITRPTVIRAEKYANDVDKIASEYGEEAKVAIVNRGRAGETAVARIVKAPKQERDKLVKAVIEAPDKFAAKKVLSKSPIKRSQQSIYTVTGNWMRDLSDRVTKLRQMTKDSPSFWITLDVQSEIERLDQFLAKKLKG